MHHTSSATLPSSLRLIAASLTVLAVVSGLSALPRLGFASAAGAGTCPSIDDTIQSCKAGGLDYQTSTRPDGCKIAECIAAGTCPRFKDEVRNCRLAGLDYEQFWDERKCERARCVAAPAEEGKCPMKWDEAKRKIANCESEPGYKAVTTENSTCLVFVDCRRATSDNVLSSEVLCRKRMENSCTIIKCDDGFAWNSCGTSMSSSSMSSSVTPVKADPCLEVQTLAKLAADELKIKKRDADVRNKLNKYKQQLAVCRRENASRK